MEWTLPAHGTASPICFWLFHSHECVVCVCGTLVFSVQYIYYLLFTKCTTLLDDDERAAGLFSIPVEKNWKEILQANRCAFGHHSYQFLYFHFVFFLVFLLVFLFFLSFRRLSHFQKYFYVTHTRTWRVCVCVCVWWTFSVSALLREDTTNQPVGRVWHINRDRNNWLK